MPEVAQQEIGSGGGGGGAPAFDWQGLLNSLLAPLQAQLQANDTANLAQRDAAIRRGYVTFGEPLDLGQIGSSLGFNFTGLIDPQTQALAKQNTSSGLSTSARLKQGHEDAIRTVTNALAGRGLLRSGETGFQYGREDQNYTRSQYDARQKLLDYFAGAQSAYLQARQVGLLGYANAVGGLSDLLAAALAAAGYGGGFGGGGGGGAAPSGGGYQPPAYVPGNSYYGGVYHTPGTPGGYTRFE